MSTQSASHALALQLDPLLAAHVQLALETARIGTWTINPQGEVIQCSEHVGEMFGHAPGFAFDTVTQWLEEIHQEDRARVTATAEAATETGQPLRVEFRSLGCDSIVRWLVSTIQLVGDHLVGVTYDRTEAERSQLLLSGEKRALECAAAANPLKDASQILAHTAVALGMEGCALYTLDADHALTRTAASGTLPTIRDADVANALRDGKPRIAEVAWLHPIRTAASQLVGCFAVTLPRNRPLNAVDTDVLNVLGRTAAIVITTHELRRHTQQANERLKATIDELESVVKLAPVGIVVVRGERVTVNRYVEELAGTSPDTTLSSNSLRSHSRVLRNGCELTPSEFPMRRAVLRGDTVDAELFQLATEGEAIKDIIVSAVPLYAADGTLRGAVGTVQDVTAIRALEGELLANRLALREQLQQLDDIYASAPIGLCVLDRDLRWVRINERLAQMNGCSAAEHIGKQVRDVLPALDERTEFLLRSVLDTGKPIIDIEIVDETPSQPGVIRYRRENWFPLRNAEGEIIGINVAVVDSTEQRRAEKALRLSEQRFRVALESSQVAFSILQAVRSETGEIVDFCWVYSNATTQQMMAEVRPFTGTLVGKRLLEMLPELRTTGGLFDHYVRVVTTGIGHDREFHYPVNGVEHTCQDICSKLDDGIAVWSLDITERTRAMQTIERQREALRVTVADLKNAQSELEVADRQKDEFLAMLAHELRNPLAAIRNAGELLARTIPNEERAHLGADIVLRQVTQLSRLVDDLMDVSRITRGRVELRWEAVKVADVVSQALETVNPLLRDRHHHLALTPHPGTLMVLGDQARLVQCLVNVLTNAAKYTAPGGHICMEVHPEGSAAVISVTDDGMGIAPELLPHVFDLFVQGDRTLDRSQGGLGIGLSVVERLIRKHGGEVSAESSGLGKGTTVRIALPLMTATEASAEDHVIAHGKHRRVLVVDDNADATDSLAAVLELEGHEVVSAYAGAEALDFVREKRPEVVLLDIGLPGMDGYVVAKRIREMEDGGNVRIVALTGYGQTEDRKRALENGFDFHLTKPVNLDRLLELLD